jgi:hypothetical protein
MPKVSGVSPTNRRVFLQMGAFALALAVTGCGGGGVTEVTDRPVIKGNRSRLDAMKSNAEQTPVNKKKK